MKIFVDKHMIELLLKQALIEGIQKEVVGGVIRDGHKVLVLRRCPTDFMPDLVELPSGTVDRGEDLFSALVREVNEETGLKVSSIDSYLGHFDYLSGSGKRARQYNFLVSVTDTHVILNPSEHNWYNWVTLDEIKSAGLNVSEHTQKIIGKVDDADNNEARHTPISK